MDNKAVFTQESVLTSTRTTGRSSTPRFGSLFTIALSLLLLFGAASQVGRIEATSDAFLGLDRQAERRIRQEEERTRTAVMIGSVPVRREEAPPSGFTLDPNPLPPQRQGVGLEAVAGAGRELPPPPLSIPFPAGEAPSRQIEEGGALDISDLVTPLEPAGEYNRPEGKTYRVENGDTWVKVAERTLGSAKRWREIFNANPTAQNGLRVGMVLSVPPGI
ncbi:MAG: LysM peptidoglycan-binding domain-containing protein [Planctomycetota bacterium]|jgi:nucleoid-associated protein YgaU|nr:LysM peptidoglycan-binding domain-containing protein [Planctomycetota bacterium]